MPTRIQLLITLLSCVAARPLAASEALLAVAASFVPPMEAVAAAFERDTQHSLKLVSGSTGGLYAQIVNGAPFDVFVAADAQRPQLLETSGHGLAGTRATVAFGRLVLLSYDPTLVGSLGLDALQSSTVRHIAIANPRVAPYGSAAQETLEAMGLWDALALRIVRGESVAQTYAMVATGNADLGFVALAQVSASDQRGSFVIIPETYYAPIRQEVVVLTRARNNPAALAIRNYLLGPAAQAIIRGYGYATESP
jgi:molybdate transport system substrate-binding protein